METVMLLTLEPTTMVPNFQTIFSGFQDPGLPALFDDIKPVTKESMIEVFELDLKEKGVFEEVFTEESWLSPMEVLQLLVTHRDEMLSLGKNFFPVSKTGSEIDAVLEVQFSHQKCSGILYPPDCPIVWVGMSGHRHFRKA